MINDNLCIVCKRNHATGKHHITPIRDGGKSKPVNMVPLCRRCHNIVEELQDEMGKPFSPYMIKYIRMTYNMDSARHEKIRNNTRLTPRYPYVQSQYDILFNKLMGIKLLITPRTRNYV